MKTQKSVMIDFQRQCISDLCKEADGFCQFGSQGNSLWAASHQTEQKIKALAAAIHRIVFSELRCFSHGRIVKDSNNCLLCLIFIICFSLFFLGFAQSIKDQKYVSQAATMSNKLLNCQNYQLHRGCRRKIAQIIYLANQASDTILLNTESICTKWD